MKRRLLSSLIGGALCLALLAASAVPLVSASNVTVEVLNPLAKIETLDNQPLTERTFTDFNGKTVRLLAYGKAANSEACRALGELLQAEYPEVTLVTSSLGSPWGPKDSQYAGWADGADAIILGVADCNVCTWWSSYHAKQLEALGVPVAVVTNSTYEPTHKAGAEDNGFDSVRRVIIDRMRYGRAYAHPSGIGSGVDIGFMKDYVMTQPDLDPDLPDRGTPYEQTIWALTTPRTEREINPPPIDPADLNDPGVDTFTVEAASYDLVAKKFNDFAMDQNFGDGLPLVMPTRELVDDMLAATTRSPDEILGKMKMRSGLITVEKVAINAVMAGAEPEYFPVILAAMEAYASAWEDGNMFYHAMSSGGVYSLLLLINGPIAEELGVANGRGYGGAANEANNTIGRAFRLSVRNLGHNETPDIDTSSRQGRVNDHTLLVFAEQEDESPWDPHHVSMGFAREQSTVTLHGYMTIPHYHGSEPNPYSPLAVLQSMRENISTNLTIALFPPSQAGVLNDEYGMDKEDVRQWFVDNGVRSKNLVWPVVVGGDPNYSQTINGSPYTTVVYQTQLITGATLTDAGRDATAPSTPQNFAVEVGGKRATLSWEPPLSDGGSPIVKYQVSNTDGVTWVDVPDGDMSYMFTGLINGAQYFFKVRAVNDITNSAEVTGSGTNLVINNRSSGRGAWAGIIARPTPPPATSIKILDPALTTPKVGVPIQLRIEVTPEDAEPQIVWSSTNPAIASVDQNGLVLASTTGVVTIYAKTADGLLSTFVSLRFSR